MLSRLATYLYIYKYHSILISSKKQEIHIEMFECKTNKTNLIKGLKEE